VIGDDAQLDVRFLQRIDIIAVIEVVINRALEFSVGTSVQMKVDTHPISPMYEA
jgi:hypothetical protein